ncbi:hypothetical protein BJ170DRAFT_597775 [Xylariales sp. AK1849]|nr:hypothetical protein BJ170DRAFT_597775 [Xylariales sp. AK1849]
MAPTAPANPSRGGGNPAPNYTTSMNSIAQLMASRSQPRDPALLARKAALSSTSTTAAAAGGGRPQKTAAQLEAAREDLELDRLAGFDDNVGVGMFKPENKDMSGRSTRKEREERMLRGRLGLLGKRKAGEEVVRRARRGDSDDDDDDDGRSGVGRAKKRKRPSADEESDGAVVDEMADVEAERGDAGDHVQMLPEDEDDTEKDDPEESGTQQDAGRIGEQSSEEAESKKKRKRKKKKKKKSKGLVVESEAANFQASRVRKQPASSDRPCV